MGQSGMLRVHEKEPMRLLQSDLAPSEGVKSQMQYVNLQLGRKRYSTRGSP
jgi:hypothetical protein